MIIEKINPVKECTYLGRLVNGKRIFDKPTSVKVSFNYHTGIRKIIIDSEDMVFINEMKDEGFN